MIRFIVLALCLFPLAAVAQTPEQQREDMVNALRTSMGQCALDQANLVAALTALQRENTKLKADLAKMEPAK